MGRTQRNYPLELIKILLKAYRYKDETVDEAFTLSLSMNPDVTFKIALWYRNTQPSSQYLFRRMLNILSIYNSGWLAANIHLIPSYGDNLDLVNMCFSQMASVARRYQKYMEKNSIGENDVKLPKSSNIPEIFNTLKTIDITPINRKLYLDKKLYKSKTLHKMYVS